jgi:hypothetical protein
MKTIPFIIGLLMGFSCVNESKNDVSRITDERLSIYNSILDDLVKNHFYNLYLGGDLDELKRKSNYDRDKPEYRIGLENLRRLVESDTSMQSTICLGHELRFIKFTQLSNEGLSNSVNFITGLSKHLGDSLINNQGIYDSLISPQKQFFPSDFQPSSFKVKTADCSIGDISFSNIFLNKLGDRGLLYYEFHCGEKRVKPY